MENNADFVGTQLLSSVVELIRNENLKEVRFGMVTNLVDYPFEIVVRRSNPNEI